MSWEDKLSKLYLKYLRDGFRILDIGTGAGDNLTLLLKYVKTGEIYSIDPDPWSLREVGYRFRVEAASRRLRLIRAYAEDLPFPDRFFDAVTSALTLHHLRDRRRFMEEAWRVLKPEGVIILLDWTPEGGGHFHSEELLEESMSEALSHVERLFKIVEKRREKLYYLLAGLKSSSKNF